jgi:Rieske Fe-S protein
MALETPSSLTRRSVLVGACGTCAVALAGCGTVAGVASPTPAATAAPAPVDEPAPSAAPTSAGKPAAAKPALASTADIPVGGGKIFASQKLVVTQPKAGTFKAFSNVCTHQGCAVTSVSNGTIICPCHGSTFDVADGSVVDGPARTALAAKKIKVSGKSITLA